MPALTFFVCVFLSLCFAWDRPFHSDEAVQAWRVWDWVFAHGDLLYEPRFHGLTLYFFAVPFYFLGGGVELVLRLLPILICAGTATALPLIVWGRERLFFNFGVSVLLATIPLWLFYSGDFIQEPLFVSFACLAGTLLFFRRSEIVGGIFLGLAVASKETWVFFVLAFWLGGLRFSWRVLGLAAGTALFFYTSFFRHLPLFDFSVPASVGNDVSYFGVSGILLLLFLFAAGFLLVYRERSRGQFFLTVSSAVLWLVYFVLPHREPWLLLSAVPGTVLAFAESLRVLSGQKKYFLLAGTVFLNALTLFVFPLEKICGYVETSRGNADFVAAICRESGTLAVYGREIWPLPWQLRERASVGYFEDEVLREDFELVVAPVEFWEKWRGDSYRTLAVGELREGVILELRRRRDF